jgi:Apea-like HEPN
LKTGTDAAFESAPKAEAISNGAAGVPRGNCTEDDLPAIRGAVKALGKRDAVKLWTAAGKLFNPDAAFVPRSIADWSIESGGLLRELRLTGNRDMLLSDKGLASLRETVALVDNLDVFEGLVAYSDIFSGCRRVVEASLSNDARPKSVTEFLEHLAGQLAPKIATHTYVIPIYGISLKGVDKLSLGRLTIRIPSKQWIQERGLHFDEEALDFSLEQMKRYLWITGSEKGTEAVSRERFVDRCKLACGLLACIVASQYERGAQGFRIGIVTAPEEGHGQALSLFWREDDLELKVSRKSTRGQLFEIDARRRDEISVLPLGSYMLRMLNNDDRTDLQEIWARALFWFSDAQRDSTPVMRFLKFWSCVEAFFSSGRTGIVQAVSFGLSASLTYGDFPFVERSEFESLRKRIRSMYAQRSAATHGAAHSHVSSKDVADLSQWVSWMLINMVLLMSRGAKTPAEAIAVLQERAGVAGSSWTERVKSKAGQAVKMLLARLRR